MVGMYLAEQGLGAGSEFGGRQIDERRCLWESESGPSSVLGAL